LAKFTPPASTPGAKVVATGSGKMPPPAAATAQSTHESFSGFPVPPFRWRGVVRTVADNQNAVGHVCLRERDRPLERREKRLKREDIADGQAQNATPNPGERTIDHDNS